MAMPTPLLNEVADAIEAEAAHFDMFSWIDSPQLTGAASEPDTPRDLTRKALIDADLTECGTVACIAGWTINLAAKKDREAVLQLFADDDGFVAVAAELLGLDYEVGYHLFYATFLDAARAAETLRRLADGEYLDDLLDEIRSR